MSAFNYIQTFKVDPNVVAGSADAMITSVEIYFKSKPAKRNTTGLANPGINVWLCEVENETPIPERILTGSIKNITYDALTTSNDSTVATVVGFNSPVMVKAGNVYGIVVKFDDPAFEIWTNVQGDRLCAAGGPTNKPSPGSQGRFGGKLHKSNNSGGSIAVSDRDLKFKVKVAQFVSNTATVSLVNKDYEFFTIDNTSSGAFIGGEYIYQTVADASGTLNVSSTSLNVVGTSTTFTSYNVGDKIVVTNGTTKDVVTITNIVDNTHMSIDHMLPFTATAATFKVPPIGTAYKVDYTRKKLFLVDSSANSSVKFAAGTRVIGVRSGAQANVTSLDKYSVDSFKPKFLIGNPSTSNYSINYRIANSSNAMNTSSDNLDLLKFNNPTYDAYILSRSVEVDTTKSSNLFGDRRKSAVANVNINVSVADSQRFSVPYLKTGQLDFYFYQNDINNTYTETRTIDGVDVTGYDTEVDKNGLARSKYLTKRINFSADRYAEDVVAYVTAYRPAGTQVRVYAKIQNAADKEPFDDKSWTPLELKSNVDQYSTDNPNDMYEYTYGLPQYPTVDTRLDGSFVTASGSNTIATTSDQSAVLNSGDLIKITNPLVDQDHEVFTVASANSTAISLYKDINNVNIIGEVTVDKLKYRNVAWNNIANDNVARYVNSSKVEFDTYSSMQIKIVLLSENTYIVPRVEQIQVIGTSA